MDHKKEDMKEMAKIMDLMDENGRQLVNAMANAVLAYQQIRDNKKAS